MWGNKDFNILFRQEFRTVQSAHLKLLGCKCQAPTINLVTTDSTVQARCVNFTNVLQAAFTLVDPESVKKYS